MIKIISFDIGNTLIENNKEGKITKLENILKKDKAEFIDQYKKAQKMCQPKLTHFLCLFCEFLAEGIDKC